MLLRRLTLRNFGVYRGEQVLDLAPRKVDGAPRPIVLIGGHNGAGKTTLLEAVRLCLYGRLALGARVTDTEYHAYLRERVHRGRDVFAPAGYASVSIEFEYAHAGRRANYTVLRGWDIHGTDEVNEGLKLLRDGEPVADVESQFWPDFIRSLIPPGVSQLFFFDGEKIKRLAEEESEADTLAESVKALLGLDLVERLQSDLEIYAARQLKRHATGTHAVRLTEIETAEQSIRSKADAARREEEDLQKKLDALQAAITRAEQRLAQSGEGLAAHQGELKQRRADLANRLDEAEKALRDLCEGALPIAVCRSVASDLRTQLEREERLARWRSGRDEAAAALKEAQSRLTSGAFPKRVGWDTATKKAVREELAALTKTLGAPPTDLKGFTEVHAVSGADREAMQQTLGEAMDELPQVVEGQITKLVQVETELRAVQGNINKAPSEDEIAPQVQQLSALQGKHAAVVLEHELKREELAALDKELAVLARERERIHKAETGAQTMATRLQLADKSRQALADYLAKLTSAKVAQLQAIVVQCFRTLCRKTDLVADISIDSTSFKVTLLDQHGDVVPKSSLSAGEKQIYAISLLWALAKVSGRPLPMIIDTPLGRLDRLHRQNLLERYLPVASHQVIVLSTDTEVDKPYFDLLRPHTSHSINLTNQPGGWTSIADGYFWEQEAPIEASA